jgi:PAS domain S-box-containing protein
LVRRLGAALEHGSVTLHHQPLVELPSSRVVAVEALARWDDEELGQVPPQVFVAAAERSGMIVELGRQVLHRACRDAATWGATSTGPVVNVNVSPLQLREADFVPVVAETLERTGLDPSRLCVEITETAAVQDFHLTDRQLEGLRGLGVEVALDDFGTGYSSLTMLRRLPVDTVKMDRAFVSHLTSDLRDGVLARLIIDAAHSMGMRVCAEGVETQEQAHQLVALGCDRAQGWLFAPARPPDDPRLAPAWAGAALLEAPIAVPEGTLPLTGTDEVVLATGVDGRIVFASAAAVRLLGTAPAALVGTAVADHLTDVDAEPGGEGGLAEGARRYEVRTPPGRSRRWIEFSTRTLRDPQGRAREAIGVARDVTEVVTAERELAESERRFRRAFDEAPIGMAMTTLDGAFLRVNTAFADLLGMAPEQVLRTTVAALTVEEDRAADSVNVAEVRRGDADVHEVSKRYRHADGHEVPARVRAAVVTGQDGAPAYIVAHVIPG